MNTFLMPPGSVVVSLGWRSAYAKPHISYFDAHILSALDHVRVLYYPSYSEWELGGGPDEVRLEEHKIISTVRDALALHASGFAIPTPRDANANVYDRLYTELAVRTGMRSHMQRTGDADYPLRNKKCITTSVERMLWSRDAEVRPSMRGKPGAGKPMSGCSWEAHVPSVLAKFQLR